MRHAISQLDHGIIQFSIHTKPDGTWLAQSSNVDGIITGGANQSDQDAMIKDAIFTYYGIAPKYAHDELLVNLDQRKSFVTA